MSTLTLVLVLGSAALHAAWNALLKREPDPELSVPGVLAAAALVGVLVAPFAPGVAFPSAASLGWALCAGALEAAYLLTLARALGQAPLPVAYTVSRGVALLLIWPISLVWLAEPAGPLALTGAALVGLGVVVVGWRRVERLGGPGVGWAAVCAVCIAGYHFAYKFALGHGADAAALVAVSLAVALPLQVLMLGAERRKAALLEVRARLKPIILTGAIAMASFYVFLLALEVGGAATVFTLRNTSVLFALIAAWMLGESPTSRQLGGGALVVVGATLLGWEG